MTAPTRAAPAQEWADACPSSANTPTSPRSARAVFRGHLLEALRVLETKKVPV